MNKHLEYVKNNSLKFNEFSEIDFDMECLIFDTESCTKLKDDNTGAKVYGWGLGCTRSTKMVYGQDLESFFSTCIKLFNIYFDKNSKLFKSKKTKGKYEDTKYIKIPCAVHNLGWDIEFLKYTLRDMGYNYRMGKLSQTFAKGKSYTTCKDVEEVGTYHIVQNDGVVYGCSIYMDYSREIKNKNGSITKVGLCLDMFDSYKIITCGESDFDKYVHGVDKMFHKISAEYDYKSFRDIGHIQSELELRYQYNDIYMLRVAIEQFYIDGLCGGIMPLIGKRTASSIAFDKLKKMTFGDEKTEEIYQSYFEIDQTTGFELSRKRIEKMSYQGGFTHANPRYVTKYIESKGCSLDINSSYPSQMSYKLFPFGKPIKKCEGYIPVVDDEHVFIVEVGFDFVKPKDDKFNLEIFKIGAMNIRPLSKIVGDVSGQEYFSSNISDDGEVIMLSKEMEGSCLSASYQCALTSVEYDFWVQHYDFGCFRKDDNGFDIVENDLDFNGLEIGDVLVYKAEIGKFRGFVEYYTKMKVENKKLGNIPLTNQAKLFLNSSYGKFGTRQDRKEQDMIIDKNGLFVFTNENSQAYEGREFYRPYASFVTAYGRLQLWNAIIYAVGVDNFLYCDTDSIYCLRDVDSLTQDMNIIGEHIDSTQLGKWDIENVFDKFKVLGQKKYMYHNYVKDKTSCKCCGLPSGARKYISSFMYQLELLPKNYSIIKIHRANIKYKKKTLNSIFKDFHLGKKIKGKKQRHKVIGGCLLLDTLFQIKRIMW